MVDATSTELWNSLFFLYLGIALVVGGLVIGWLLWSLVKYRSRPGSARPKDAPIPGVQPAERGHVLWVYIMTGGIAAIMFGLAFSTISAVEEVDHPPVGEPSLFVNVTGYQFGWIFDYQGDGGIPVRQTTPSDAQGLYAPVGVPVVMNVTSRDVWHNFAIPNFRIRVDAIPGETNHLWFKATQTGDDHTVCVMLCGSNHAAMRADMHVLSQKDFDAWLTNESAKAYAKLEAAGSARNVTLARAAYDVNNATVAPGKGLALHVTNADITGYHLPDGRELAPGASAWVYAVGPADGRLDTSLVTIFGCPPGGNCK